MTPMKQLYDERMNRYLTAMKNEKPDRIPIRPFVAEFTAKYAGYTCQEVTHDYHKAFAAVRKCAADFDWDAVVANMVYVWTGLTQAIGIRYYGVPGLDIPPDVGFQYKEPAEENAFMKSDEYDRLIDDPTAFLYEVWLPRISTEIKSSDAKTSYRHNLALVKGGMAMLDYFNAFGPQIEALKNESGTVSAIAGIFKAPFDILADKLRGYIGLTMDMATQPKKVLQACEALMLHLYHVAKSTADVNHQVPIGFWMHRGCTPFVSAGQFESHYWPTLRPIIEQLWRDGHQTLFYAEGDWINHLDSFAGLPEKSIVYHVDNSDIFATHKKLGEKFCLSGGIPNFLLAYRSADEVRAHAKKVIDEVAADGGYIMDASAIMQSDTTVENLKALTDFTCEYGIYSGGSPAKHAAVNQIIPDPQTPFGKNYGMAGVGRSKVEAGICLPWAEKVKEIESISGDETILRETWDSVESFANMFIWQCLLSF